MNLYTQYLEKLQSWWWPPPVQLSPIQAFKAQLQSSKIDFITKHSDSNIILQRLCMMYSQLISEYKEFNSTLQVPLQCIVKENSQTERVPNIYGKIKIQTEKIKCELVLTVVVHAQIQNQLPKVYIRNTEPSKMQPNPKYNELYKPVIGGVQVKIEKIYEGKWEEYKSSNMLKLIKNCEKTIVKYFPYMKKIHKDHIDHTQLPESVKSLRQILNKQILLQNMQSLTILKESLNSETKFLKEENRRLERQTEQKSFKSLDFIKVEEGESEEILELLVQQKALRDVWVFLQKQFVKKETQLQFQQIVENLKQLQGKLFQIKYKLNLLTNSKNDTNSD